MKGGLPDEVSLIAVEDAGLVLIVLKRQTQQQRCFHESRFVAGNAGLFSHAEKRPLGRGKRWVEKQSHWLLDGIEEGS
jgi:hypothetical protein